MADDVQSDFENNVDRWNREVLARRPPADFSALVTALPGVYPSDVWSSVQRLVASGELSSELMRHLRQTKNATRSAAAIEPPCPLPVPHPLDFDWRFSGETVDHLLNQCADLTASEDTVVFLGAPRLAIRAARSSFIRPFRCLDRNPAVVATVARYGQPHNAMVFDAAIDPIPFPSTAAAVCIDPPWYLPQFRSFLWAASTLCRAGGHVLLSVPAIGTRPGMAADWEHMRSWADQCGLSLVNYERSALAYVAPPFEQNALRAGGFAGVCTRWRRSDLAVFVRNDWPPVARPDAPAALVRWPETVVDSVAFRVRPSAERSAHAGFRDPRLRPLIPGDILPSVSARDARRERADVWTTGNRIFGCAGTKLFETILQAFPDGAVAVPSRIGQILGRALRDHESVQVLQTVQQIRKFVTIERNEQANGFRDVQIGVAT